MTGSMLHLVLATACFLLIHIVPSSYMRAAVVGKVGEGPYLGLFSLCSGVIFIWMIFAYIDAPYGPILWELDNVGRYAAIILMVVASILFVSAYTTRNPTAIGGQKVINNPAAKGGINAVTRHPLMWSIALWSLAHLLNNGDLKSVIFFAGLMALAVIGTYMIDAKRAKELGEDWKGYIAATSNIPFMALLGGRAAFSIKQLWWRILLGLFVFMAFFHLHMMVIGVSPFPL